MNDVNENNDKKHRWCGGHNCDGYTMYQPLQLNDRQYCDYCIDNGIISCYKNLQKCDGKECASVKLEHLYKMKIQEFQVWMRHMPSGAPLYTQSGGISSNVSVPLYEKFEILLEHIAKISISLQNSIKYDPCKFHILSAQMNDTDLCINNDDKCCSGVCYGDAKVKITVQTSEESQTEWYLSYPSRPVIYYKKFDLEFDIVCIETESEKQALIDNKYISYKNDINNICLFTDKITRVLFDFQTHVREKHDLLTLDKEKSELLSLLDFKK